MQPAIYIDANEFMETLLAKGLVIVSVKELQASKEIDRNRLMRRKALSLSEIVRANLLPLKTVKGIADWIRTGKIKPGETYQEKSGYKRVMVLTSAIKRLGYGE